MVLGLGDGAGGGEGGGVGGGWWGRRGRWGRGWVGIAAAAWTALKRYTCLIVSGSDF